MPILFPGVVVMMSLTGGAGNDILDGGAGDDIAIYAGNMADYKIDVGREGLTRITDLNSGDGDEGVDSSLEC